MKTWFDKVRNEGLIPHMSRTDVVLTCISAVIEVAGVVYFVHRRKWFRV